MARAHQVAGVVFLLLGLFIVYQSAQLLYFSRLGPGPGFFGVWLGGLMALLALVFLVQNTLPRWRSDQPLALLPPAEVRLRLALTVVSLAVVVILLPILGFRVTMFLLSLFLLAFVGRQSWPVSLAVSLVASVGVYYAFTNLLGVVLPTGVGGI